jgi:hypothetical protein
MPKATPEEASPAQDTSLEAADSRQLSALCSDGLFGLSGFSGSNKTNEMNPKNQETAQV